MNTRTWLCALAPWLAACGGGGGDSAAAAPAEPLVAGSDLPTSAIASVEAYSRFTAARPADDQAEPLAVESVDPPTSDSAEPVDLS